MTIRVSPERSTLSLPPGRLRSEEARSPAFESLKGSDRSAAGPKPAPGKADAAQLRATTALLDRASSVADAAVAAADTITGLLERLREMATAAREPGAAPDPEFPTVGALLAKTVQGAAFDGVNLLDGSQAGGVFRVPVAADEAGELTLGAFDLTPGGSEIPVTGDEDPASTLEALGTSLSNTAAARTRLGDDAKRVEAHRSFVSVLAQAVNGGGPEAIDVEGARLAALQLRQSLGAGRVSIANGAPETVLALFR